MSCCKGGCCFASPTDEKIRHMRDMVALARELGSYFTARDVEVLEEAVDAYEELNEVVE